MTTTAIDIAYHQVCPFSRTRAVCESSSDSDGAPVYTRNFLTFVNTTTIVYGQKPAAPADFLPICNSSRVYKRQKITSTVL